MAKRKFTPYKNGDYSLGQRRDERGIPEAIACYYDENGKRHRARLGVPLTDEAGSRKALDKFADDARALKARQAQSTVGELWKLWMTDRKADKYDNTIYEHHWKAMKPWFENRAPLLLKAQDFRDYAQSRFDIGRKPATVNTELRRLNACLKWAFDTRLLPLRPLVWIPADGDGRKRVLTVDEARRIRDVIDKSDPHVKLFIIIVFATGARHRAILDLTWNRVDFDENSIEFDEDLPPDPMSKAWRKGRAKVPMSTAVRAVLWEAKKGAQTDYVIEHGGRRLKSIKDGFRWAMERAGIGWYLRDESGEIRRNKKGQPLFRTDVTPHTIRHTVATWLDERAIATTRTAQLLGHEDEMTTKKHYTHASVEVLRPVVEALDDMFTPLPKISHIAVEDEPQKIKKRRLLSQRDNDKSADLG